MSVIHVMRAAKGTCSTGKGGEGGEVARQQRESMGRLRVSSGTHECFRLCARHCVQQNVRRKKKKKKTLTPKGVAGNMFTYCFSS